MLTVFKLPILQSFGIGNLTHTVNIIKLNSTVEVESLRIKHLNSSIQDDDFENQLALISSIRNLNKQLGDTIKERNESIAVPWNSITFWSWNMVSVASLILGIICCILKLRGKGSENHGENITVVNQTPPAIGHWHREKCCIFQVFGCTSSRSQGYDLSQYQRSVTASAVNDPGSTCHLYGHFTKEQR